MDKIFKVKLYIDYKEFKGYKTVDPIYKNIEDFLAQKSKLFKHFSINGYLNDNKYIEIKFKDEKDMLKNLNSVYNLCNDIIDTMNDKNIDFNIHLNSICVETINNPNDIHNLVCIENRDLSDSKDTYIYSNVYRNLVTNNIDKYEMILISKVNRTRPKLHNFLFKDMIVSSKYFSYVESALKGEYVKVDYIQVYL